MKNRDAMLRAGMLADNDFHPETRNLTPETRHNSHNSKYLILRS